MSNLLTEINRMRSLMGIKNPINESYLNNRVLLKENTGIGELMNLYKGIFKKGAKSLTSEESKYLKGLIDEYNLRFPDNTIKFQNGLDNIGLKMLSDFINKETDDIITNVFERSIKNINASEAILKLNTTDNLLKQELLKSNVDVGLTNINNTMDFLAYVQKNGNGDITRTDLPFEALSIAKEEMLLMSSKMDSFSNDPVKKYIDDLINQIDELEGKTKVPDPEIKSSIPDIKTSLNDVSNVVIDIKPLSKEEISTKLNNLVNSDQTMRQGSDMDVNVDITNQNELKKLMGEDKEGFIKNLENFEDLRNLWLIIQHSDNDIQLQKEILDILKNNKQTLETKFPSNSKDIKSGIAMLEDRIMVNSNTSVSGYRDTGMDDFGDLTKGKQTYGSQGGINENGEWIPRPIELDGKLYFFETQQELLNNTEFLNKLNAKRFEMGMVPMEDYLKTFNESSKFIEEPIEIIKNINTKGPDKTILDVFGKNGIFYVEGIQLVRELTNKFLKDYQKLYLDGVSQKEVQDYKNALNLLKQKFGDKKIFSQSIEDGSKTKKLTLNDFIIDVENGYKRLYDENGNWSPLNKLDTNWNDMPLELTKFIKTVLSSTEYDNFIKKIQDYVNVVDNTEKIKLKGELDKEFENIRVKLNQNENYVKNWINRTDEITKNIIKNTNVGNLSEQKVNELFQKNGLKVEFTASEGSPIDVLLSIDQIVTDVKGIFGGGQKTVQTKTAGKITEGEFQIVDGKRTWVEKSGTNAYRVELLPGQRISKQSQIDLAGFYDPNSGKTIITGKQKSLVKDGTGKIMYNPDGTPIYSNIEELPGTTLVRPKNSKSPYAAFIIESNTNKIVG